MEIKLFADAIDDMDHWRRSGNKSIQKKILQLFEDIERHPFEGIGKPEALKYDLSGKWSRRINSEHRIVYDVIDDVVNIYSLKGHYNK